LKTYQILSIVLGLVVALAGCARQPVAQAAVPTPTTPPPGPTPCVPRPVIAPTLPAEIPGYTELDPATGLHVTGTVQEVDLESYRLEVTGKVDNPLTLTYDELRCMPKVELRCTLVCVGFFEDEATWAGASLAHVLDLAGVQDEAVSIRLVSADGYTTYVGLEDARREDSFLAYEWEGEPVPILHGFPVRAVFPTLDGNNWAKWLVEIEVI
jgi:DMSO/TMAO reductase YedYZ molybdopterin-dependent catalytic subunit